MSDDPTPPQGPPVGPPTGPPQGPPPGPGVGGAPWDRTPPPPSAPLPPPVTDLPSLAGSTDAPAPAAPGASTWGQDDGTPKPSTAEAWAEVSAMDRPAQPKRFQNRPSRRGGGGGGFLRIFGLVGVLVTIVILGFLAVKVLSGTETAAKGAGGGAATSTPASPGSTPPGPAYAGPPASASADASPAACETNRQAVLTAAAAFAVQNGRSAKDVSELVAAGLLTEAPPNITLVPGPDGRSGQVEGTGPCA